MNKLSSNYSATHVPFNGNVTGGAEDKEQRGTHRLAAAETDSDILDAEKRHTAKLPDQATMAWLQRLMAGSAYTAAPDGDGRNGELHALLQSFFDWLGRSKRSAASLIDDKYDDNASSIASEPTAHGTSSKSGLWNNLLARLLGDAAVQQPNGSSPGTSNTEKNIGPDAGATSAPDASARQTPVARADPAPAGGASSSAAQPPNSISVRDFGAKGDGVSDDQAAIQNAFDAARASGQSVWMPPGTYKHSGVLTANGIKVSGAGEATVLSAGNPDHGALKLTGNNGAISNMTVELNSGHRSSMPDAAAICVQGATNATISHVKTIGAASNGIRLDNALNCKITNNLVMGSNADGIALMNGSCFNSVENNVVYQAGDDAFSDNSYIGDRRQDEGNVFRNNLALDNKYGRGFALMGSKNAVVEHNTSNGTPGHGIAVGTDYNSDTMVGTGHIVRNNLFLRAADTPVAADGMTVENNRFSGPAPSLSAILGWTPSKLPDRSEYNAAYVPGTGPGANNTPGNRS